MEIIKKEFRMTPEFIFPAIGFLGPILLIIVLCLGTKVYNTPTPYNFCAYGLGGISVIILLAIFFWPTKEDDDEDNFNTTDNEGS